MNLKMTVQNSETGTIYDISELVGNIKYDTELSESPGKLTFICQRDPNGILQIECGSLIHFIIDDFGIFVGYVFDMSTDGNDVYSITAYDQMRYLKNKEVYQTSNQTASEIFESVCKDSGLKYEVVTPSVYKPDDYVHDNATLFSVIQYGIDRANTQEANKHYFIRDNYGTLQFTELKERKTNIIIGEESLLTSFKYNISIDSDTFNTVKIYRENKDTGKREVWKELDSYNQGKWGLLQHLEKANDNMNEAQIREYADKLLKLKNRETQSLKLTAIGAKEITAGSGFRVSLPIVGIEQDMWVKKASHKYSYLDHIMDLEVVI